MKVFVLALFSLIFSVNSEDAKPAQSKVLDAIYPLNKDYSYGSQGNIGIEENRQRNNYRNEGRPSQIYGNQGNIGIEENRQRNNYRNEGRPSQIYGNQGNIGIEGNRQGNNYRNEGRPSQIYGNNNYGYRRENEYNRNNRNYGQLEPETVGYYARDPEGRRFYGLKRNYQYRLIGRVGLGFDKRTANTYSYLAPITPERLELVGTRPFQLNNNGYNYQNLNLYRGLNVDKHI